MHARLIYLWYVGNNMFEWRLSGWPGIRREITFLFSLSGNVFAAAVAYCARKTIVTTLWFISSSATLSGCVFPSPLSTDDNNDLFSFHSFLFVSSFEAKSGQLMCVLTLTLCRVGGDSFFSFFLFRLFVFVVTHRCCVATRESVSFWCGALVLQ